MEDTHLLAETDIYATYDVYSIHVCGSGTCAKGASFRRINTCVFECGGFRMTSII